jgi:hypothetical protein
MWCRDERCDRNDLHFAHEISTDLLDDDDGLPSKSTRPAWQRPASKALDHSIAKATSKTYPKHLDAILRDVQDDYGSCEYRTVQRHLARLVERGHIIRVDLGRRLYAYLRPGSSLVRDVELMRDQIECLIEQAANA